MARDIERFRRPVHQMGATKDLQVKDTPAGILTFDYHGSPLDILHEPVGSRVTVVAFHAAIGKTTDLPIFAATHLVAGLDCNLVSVSDPSLVGRPIRLGWHIGNAQQPLQSDLPNLLANILDAHGAEHVIFLGASGGGFAALYYSTHFPGSLAIPLNPQTSVGAYLPSQVELYLSHCFGVKDIDELPQWVTTDLSQLYEKRQANSVAYFQNLGDKLHIRAHLPPFLSRGHDQNHLLTKLVDQGPGHTIVHTTVIRQILDAAITSAGSWPEALLALGFENRVTPEDVAARRSSWEAAQN